MNSFLKDLEPVPVWHYFQEICNIPHGSGNEKKISDYLKNFAQERGLFCIQDEWNNIILVKEATAGYEQEETVIIQGHMDMVAVKNPELEIDMTTDSLQLRVKDDYVYAEGTSLGGDDGIAVAYALAILDSDTISHPRLEVILTVDEEVGMIGAQNIDVSMLKGRKMLNLDNEEEGILLTSCAGGARVDCTLPLKWENRDGYVLHLKACGFTGGHSGVEIHKGGGNSNCIMGRVLDALRQKMSIALVSINGGLADNAIPRETDAYIVVKKDEVRIATDLVQTLNTQIQAEYHGKDEQAEILLSEQKEQSVTCLKPDVTDKVIDFILALPNGVQAMSADVEGLVETSLNMGIMQLSEEGFRAQYAVRSSVESAKQALYRRIQAVCNLTGAVMEIHNEYPGWAYQPNSPLRDKLIRIYEEMYGKKPEVQAIHAGLECGLFAGKIQGLDCISFGPDMKNIHTTEEVLSISSVQRVWKYLLEILRQK